MTAMAFTPTISRQARTHKAAQNTIALFGQLEAHLLDAQFFGQLQHLWVGIGAARISSIVMRRLRTTFSLWVCTTNPSSQG
jgi:hypothetical protein